MVVAVKEPGVVDVQEAALVDTMVVAFSQRSFACDRASLGIRNIPDTIIIKCTNLIK